MPGILDSEIKFLTGVGPRRATLLEKELNIKTFGDMLLFFPFRYIDRSRIYTINEIEPSMSYIQLRGRISRMNQIGERGPGKRLVVTLTDTTGSIDLVFFQGIKWIKERIKLNQEYIVFGKPTIFNQTINIVHPEIDLTTEENPYYVGNMLGVYSSTEKLRSGGMSNKVIAKLQATLLKQCYEAIKETLPIWLTEEKRFMSYREALQNIHFPADIKKLAAAQFRLKFEELFYLQVSLLKQKGLRERNLRGIPMPRVGEFFNICYSKMPFELTNAQKRVIREIREDFKSGRQMNRLLQGDVGSGKTMVAILCSLLAADNGFQSCIMAPTEVLANQHYNGSLTLLSETGVKTALLTGNTKAKERREILEGISNGSIHILFGTHALIEDNVQFENLGFAVIDEQHRLDRKSVV